MTAKASRLRPSLRASNASATSNSQATANAWEVVPPESLTADAPAPARGTADGGATPQRPLDEQGELTDIDLGSPPEVASAPQLGDLVPLSTPLPQSGAALSNGAVAARQPRSDIAGGSQSDEPEEIEIGTGVRSITLTTYEDSEPLPPGTVTLGGQPADDQVRASSQNQYRPIPAMLAAVWSQCHHEHRQRSASCALASVAAHAAWECIDNITCRPLDARDVVDALPLLTAMHAA